MIYFRFFIIYDQTDEGLIDQQAVLDILVRQEGSLQKVVDRFQKAAIEVIERDSYFLSGKKTKFIDISSVLKAIPIHWVANEIVRRTSNLLINHFFIIIDRPAFP